MRKPAPNTGLPQLEELRSLAWIGPSAEAIGHGLQAERTPPPADACGTVFSLCAIMESFYAESTPDRLVRLPHLTKGKIMKELMPKVKGKADGKLVSELVASFMK